MRTSAKIFRCDVVIALVACVLVTGCMSGMSSTRKIGDTVHDMNDQARWGRVGDAAQYVEPGYRSTYLASHRLWGSTIQLADAEVVHVQIAEGAEHATAFVTYSWYAMDTMTLHQSIVRQRWQATKDRYTLTQETVVQGDPQLLGQASGGSDDITPVSFMGSSMN